LKLFMDSNVQTTCIINCGLLLFMMESLNRVSSTWMTRNGAEGQLMRVNGIALMRSLIRITVFLSIN
jgi:hypothetical protein